jgi:L,D-transpeptidase YcbB
MKSHAVILPGALVVLASLLEPSASSRDRTGRLNQEAWGALSLLAAAGREGLDPADYDAAELQRIAGLLERGGAPSTDLAAFDERLTATVARYLHDLHEGRVDPRALGFRMNAPPDGHDFAALVRAAVADHRLAALAEEFTSHLALYRNLRSALARYRLLAADADPEPFRTGPSVRRGDVYPAAQILKRRLEALGDLPEDSSTSVAVPPLYAGSLVEGVTRFQRRHGLEPDGVLGPATQAAHVGPASQPGQRPASLGRPDRRTLRRPAQGERRRVRRRSRRPRRRAAADSRAADLRIVPWTRIDSQSRREHTPGETLSRGPRRRFP